uniref:Protein-tyrosine-phosphatase n=1 Tax=Strigamia maritima TaxID=126957 RepID=T1ITA2_STRMM
MPRLRIGAHGVLLASKGNAKKRKDKQMQVWSKESTEQHMYGTGERDAAIRRPKGRRHRDTSPVENTHSVLPAKLQLTMLNRGLLSTAEQERALKAIPVIPVPLSNYAKHVEQRRQYPVLFRGEWQPQSNYVIPKENVAMTYMCIPKKKTKDKKVSHCAISNLMQTDMNDMDREYKLNRFIQLMEETNHSGKAHSRSLSAFDIKDSKQRQLYFTIEDDYNRVVLDTMFGVPDTDYINASWIDTFHYQSILKPNAYIATQGPSEKTINDLWRMVWQVQTPCIIMLTKTFDFIKVMCNQYWPNNINQTEQYGMIQVTVVQFEQLANFVIRTIKMKKGEEERTVYQYHYTEWHSHCCPFASALLEFRRRVRLFLKTIPDSGPIVVHCNDGAGRTGVFIAIDANLEYSEEDGVFDVFNFCKKLRSSRKGLVESLEQYKFIYETLEEFVVCGNSWFPLADLSQKMKLKSQRKGLKRMNDYEREFQQICKMAPKFTIGDCAGGHRLENREKNRDVIVVPPDNSRPYLTSFQGNDCTDYINAVFVDGYDRCNEYIVTEWPMKHTMGDVWSLVYDHDCKSVVILCNPSTVVIPTDEKNNVEKNEKEKIDPHKQYPSFWPENGKTVKYGPIFTVESVSSNHYPNVRTWIFRINKKVVSLQELMAGVKAEPKTVQFFQFMCWPMGHRVPTSTNALVELMNMVERWRQRSGFGPVLVISSDGASRVGVYCAANSAIEQVRQHQEVDVFQAVKTVRRHRPALIENMTEYKYCYDLVLHYVLFNLHKKAGSESRSVNNV